MPVITIHGEEAKWASTRNREDGSKELILIM